MSLTVPAELDWDRDDRNYALRDLRAARRRNRVSQLDRFDAFYKAYVTAIASGIAIYATAGWFGTEPITGNLLAKVTDLAPIYLGLAVAAILAVAMRSGGRGGPFALEKADVRHIMLAPVAREDVLRGEAIRTIRHAAFLGGTVGAIIGIIATRRLPGHPAEWIAGPMIYCAAIAMGAYGLALICSGFRINRVVTDVVGFLLVVWAAADAILQIPSSPFAWISHVAVWPLEFDLLGLLGIGVMLALAGLGIFAAPGWQVEVAERRSGLVGQLRFAATMQDVRTVMILQRQLAQEQLRVKPIIRLPKLRKAYDRKGQPLLRVYVRRVLHTYFRWSFFRFLRLVVFAILAGFAIFAAWQSTIALIVVAGLLFWVIALELLEALAQESDHPDRLIGLKRAPGWDQFRLMAAPAYAMLILVLISAATVGALAEAAGDTDGLVLLLGIPTVLVIVVSALGGASLAVTKHASAGGGGNPLSPEITGLVTLWKVAVPPALAIAGLVPMAFAHRDFEVHQNARRMVETMNTSWYIVLGFGIMAIAWVRLGSSWKDKMQASTAEAAEMQKEKAAKKAKDDKSSTNKAKPAAKKTAKKASKK